MGVSLKRFGNWLERTVKQIFTPENILAATIYYFSGATIGKVSEIVSTAIYAATNAALQTLSTPNTPDVGGFGDEAQGRLVNFNDTTAPRTLIYGKVRVGGLIAHAEATNDDKYLLLVNLLASHEVNAIDTVYFDGKALTLSGNNVTSPARFNGKAKVYTKL